MTLHLNRFKAIWVEDFEFYSSRAGEIPRPVCFVAQEVYTGARVMLWQDDFPAQCPLEVGPDTLHVAFGAQAEWGCYLSLGWQLPARVIDLFAEYRTQTNNLILPDGASLLGALSRHGIAAVTKDYKKTMRDQVLTGGPWTAEQRHEILRYCLSDVVSTVDLWRAMLPRIDIPCALHRGRYTTAVARMEHTGIPLDVVMLDRLRGQWPEIQTRLIQDVDRAYGVFDGTVFKQKRFERWLVHQQIPWPRHESSGKLDMRDDTFEDMARAYPILTPLRELRSTLASFRIQNLAVGSDGFNRAGIRPFRATTSRNQPKGAESIFAKSRWVRHLIKPPEGYGVAYIDYSQQEFAVAAALSGDPAMMESYNSGDPYMSFAVQAGLAPPGATKASHKVIRDKAKQAILATQYGQTEHSLGPQLGVSVLEACHLLDLHRRTYARFWQWAEGVLHYAMLKGRLWTLHGWDIYYGPRANKVEPKSIQNFLMQGGGADITRLACILATEAGIAVCCPVHDALMILAPLERLEEDIATTQRLMQLAGEYALGGFILRTDAAIFRFPERYREDRGADMWARVCKLLQ